MGLIRKVFGAQPLATLLQRARAKLAAGDFEQAQKIVATGMDAYPGVESLRDLELTIRRAQARAGMQSLRERIQRDDDPRAYEELISLYLELGMSAEARREAMAYWSAHIDRDAPHLILGEMSLQAFLEDLRAPDAHFALQRLHRAAALNTMALRPRLLLAELYWCVGADHALFEVVDQLRAIAPEDPLIEPLLDEIEGMRPPRDAEGLDGLFERVEVEGALVREPKTWPLPTRRFVTARLDETRAQRLAASLVARGAVTEVVLLQRNGTLLGHARQGSEFDPGAEDLEPEAGSGLEDVAQTVAKTITRYAREFDLGSFKRCTIEGDFGLVMVGELGGVVTGARWGQNPEPQLLWDRIAVDLEGSLGGHS